MAERFRVFPGSEVMGGLSGNPGDLQRRNWLMGNDVSDHCFAGIWTRKRRGDLTEQDWRYHDADEVEFIVKGLLHVQIANEAGELQDEFTAGEGDFFFIGEGVPHRADAAGDGECIGLLFCPKPYDMPAGQTSFVLET